MAISSGASLINLVVDLALLRAGRHHRSVTLESDGRHLVTDVWMSIGVIAGVAAVGSWLGAAGRDHRARCRHEHRRYGRRPRAPLHRRSAGPRMTRGRARRHPSRARRLRLRRGRFHALRTRQAGRRSFASLHVLVPGDWTVQHDHDLLERLEATLRDAVPD